MGVNISAIISIRWGLEKWTLFCKWNAISNTFFLNVLHLDSNIRFVPMGPDPKSAWDGSSNDLIIEQAIR